MFSLSTICIQGCAPAMLVAGVGYAVSSGRRASAEMIKAKGEYTDRYNTYKLGMEGINMEREKAGLEPRPIDSFEEWLDKQPLTPEEQKLFTRMKAQTPKQFRELDEQKDKETQEQTESTTNFGTN